VAKRRLLFIGLDAADALLIDRWCDAGLLPNIARMKARGTSWPALATPAEVFHVSAWPSIFTGTPPDVHGLYHAYVTRPGHQGLLRPRPDESPVPFLWKLLSDHGKRTVVMDAFLTCPLRDFLGVQIVDWGSWSWFWDPTIVPASVGRDIRRKFGSYPFEDHSRVGVTPIVDFAGFRSRLLTAVARKTQVVKWLLEREDWDLFLVVFGEAHPAGHYLWHFDDQTYFLNGTAAPDQPSDSERGMGEPLRDVYVALDTAIGDLLSTVGEGTTVLLVSGDGMGPNYSGSHLLHDVLLRLGAGVGDAAAAGEEPGGRAGGDAPGGLAGTIRNMIPQSLRIAISNVILSRQMQEKLSLRWKTSGIAWDRTKAFVIENANEGYIRINLKGREPLGIVSAGAEYEQLRDRLYDAARRMTNPQTGKPAAAAVYKTDDICHGERRSHMPDIVIIWNVDARITTELLMAEHGLVRLPHASCQMPPYYTGNHAARAFAVAMGPDVPQGVEHRGRDVIDLAPTILNEFGIEPPAHMAGALLGELHGTTRSRD
jgi:predicted AlkP superfamily phosphohydrolase/phosphomutase